MKSVAAALIVVAGGALVTGLETLREAASAGSGPAGGSAKEVFSTVRDTVVTSARSASASLAARAPRARRFPAAATTSVTTIPASPAVPEVGAPSSPPAGARG